MTTSLATRLEAARRSRFVGRTTECELVRQALSAPELPFQVLYLFGQGGVGKTTLLRQFREIAQAANLPAHYLDARELQPSPLAFTVAVQNALHLSPTQAIGDALAALPTRQVLLVDTFETLTGLIDWLREEFLPQLPDTVLTVFASRNPPPVAWRSDPGWQGVMRVLPLRNFNTDESRLYLAAQQMPQISNEASDHLLNFTHGHPLALSLAVEALRQRPDAHLPQEASRDIIHALVERFLQDLPSPMHRNAVELCALVRMTTETLLEQLLVQDEEENLLPAPHPPPHAPQLFQWLRGLSFIELGTRGLFPHDLAREAILADLNWRNPDRYRLLHQRARQYYASLLSKPGDRQRLLSDYLYLHRESSGVRSFFEWQETGALVVDQLRPNDQEAVSQLVARWEGEESAQLARDWMTRQPRLMSVLREVTGKVVGFLGVVALESVTPADLQSDPAVAAAAQYLMRYAPLQAGEHALLFRFWMTAESYQQVSPTQSRIFLQMLQHYLNTPQLAYTFIPCADPQFWAKSFVYASLRRLEQADFTIGGKAYGMYGQNWRTLSPLSWLLLLGEPELGAEVSQAGSLAGSPSGASITPAAAAFTAMQTETILLDEDEFGEAVKHALRDFTNANALRSNPLLKTRLILSQAALSPNTTATPSEKVEVLRNLIKEGASHLQKSPKQLSFYRVLHHTYFQPAATQEVAAELLDLPFSTYRRHLRSGIEWITDWLWQREGAG